MPKLSNFSEQYNTVSLAVRLLAVGGQGGACASWYRRPETWKHCFPSFFLVSQPASPCHLSSRAPCVDDYGWSGSMASVRMLCLLLRSLSVGWQPILVSATVTAVSEPSVVLVTAITGLQIWRHFRLRPKPEKLVSVGLYCNSICVYLVTSWYLWHWCYMM